MYGCCSEPSNSIITPFGHSYGGSSSRATQSVGMGSNVIRRSVRICSGYVMIMRTVRVVLDIKLRLLFDLPCYRWAETSSLTVSIRYRPAAKSSRTDHLAFVAIRHRRSRRAREPPDRVAPDRCCRRRCRCPVPNIGISDCDVCNKGTIGKYEVWMIYFEKLQVK